MYKLVWSYTFLITLSQWISQVTDNQSNKVMEVQKELQQYSRSLSCPDKVTINDSNAAEKK